MTIEHTSCGRCGRKLKTVKSMHEGFGPVCKKKFEEEKASKQMELPFDDTEDVESCVMCKKKIDLEKDEFEFDEGEGYWCMPCASQESDGGNE